MRSIFLIPLFCAVVVAGLFSASVTQAQEDIPYLQTKGEVLEVVSTEYREVGGTGTQRPFQTLRIEIIEGEKEGQIITTETDFPRITKGTTLYLGYWTDPEGGDHFDVVGIDRLVPMLILAGVFVAIIILFGGWRGVRSLLSLGASFFILLYVLVPGLLGGWNPLLASSVVAGGILFGAIFFTHGFNRESFSAYAGTMIAILLTGALALVAVNATSLSGFADESSLFLNFNTQGSLDFVGLLLGAIIIGALGVLDDIAITQAAVVNELYKSNASLKPIEVYRRALRVGREHVGALVNTLALAYTGAALPLILLFSVSSYRPDVILNMEMVATEIVRILVGSIGLVLAVPVVTALAVILLRAQKKET